MREVIKRIVNPDAPGYPCAGDMIDIQGFAHPHLGDYPGHYIVDQVIEYIPPGFCVDEDGRDIRIFLAGPKSDCRFSVAWNGAHIRDCSRVIGHCARWTERKGG